MLRIIYTLITLLILSGCSSTSIKSTAISTKKPLAQNSGVIALQIVNNTDKLATWHKGWTEVIIFRTDNAEEIKKAAIAKAKSKHKSKKPFDPEKVEWNYDFYTLTPHSQGVLESQIFLGSVPQGEYMISSLYSFYRGGDFSSWISMPVFRSTGHFNVNKKQITNLGTVVFQPLLNNKESNFWSNRSSFKAYVTKVNQQQDLKSLILEHYPKLASQLDLSTELNWTVDPFDSFREELSKLSQLNSYGANGLALKTLGNNIILSKLGTIRLQSKKGEWKTINLNTNSQLASVIEIENQLVIGGELGQVFISDSTFSDWSIHKPISSKEAVVWFGTSNKKYYAATQSASQFSIYEVSDIKSAWTKIGTFKRKSKGSWVRNGGLFPFINDQDQIGVINDNSRYLYNETSKKWSKLKSTSLVSMAQLANGELVAVDVSQWDGVGDQLISFDYAKTWKSIKRPLYRGGAVEGSMPVIMNGKVISVGRKKLRKEEGLAKLSIVSADFDNVSKSKKWKFHNPIKENCTKLLPELSQKEEIYMLCDQGEVVSSNDLGATWKTVLPLDITKMQKTYEEMLNKQKESKTEI
jgi:hypothetical protein